MKLSKEDLKLLLRIKKEGSSCIRTFSEPHAMRVVRLLGTRISYNGANSQPLRIEEISDLKWKETATEVIRDML